jgi:hypothetical protein
MLSELKIGDRVRLKGGKNIMTLVDIFPLNPVDSEEPESRIATCAFEKSGKLKYEKIYLVGLEKVAG